MVAVRRVYVKYGVKPLNGLDDMVVVVWEGWAGCVDVAHAWEGSNLTEGRVQGRYDAAMTRLVC
jgi:hypothetical protein